MRNILLILLTCFGLTSIGQPLSGIVSSSQNNVSIGNAIPTSGLVREYLLNGDGVETISAANGTLTGCTPIVGINGEANGALSFNGSSSYVSFTATSIYDNFSVSLWVNLYNVTTSSWIIGNGLTGIRYNGTDFKMQVVLTLSTALSWTKVNSWAHIILERTAPTTYDLYINNTLLGTMTCADSTGLQFGLLGKRSDGFYLNGQIDNLRIYNRVLTSGERSSLFAEKL